MRTKKTDGDLKNYPSVSLFCVNRECMWCLINYVDDINLGERPRSELLDSDAVRDRLIKHYNEGIKNLKEVKNDNK